MSTTKEPDLIIGAHTPEDLEAVRYFQSLPHPTKNPGSYSDKKRGGMVGPHRMVHVKFLDHMRDRIEELKRENKALRDRIAELERENGRLRRENLGR